ncbi:hypothetical protein EC957_011757, partial [Mortierella hygrophila]
MHNQPPNSPNQDSSRPASGRRSTGVKTVVRSRARDQRAREGSVADHQQPQAPTGDLTSRLDQAEGSSNRNSGILTQSVRFDPESIHSASTPISVGSASDPESEEESAEDDEDEEYDADATRTSISVPEDLDGSEQGEVVPETPHEDFEEEQQDVEGFGGPDVINVDLDPTGPIPRWPQAPAPAPSPRPSNTVLGKRERSLDLADYYYERLKSSYADEESEVNRARSLGVETPQGREALERATWKRRETRDLRQELRVWVTPLSRPLDPNVAAVSKTLEGLSVT